MIELVIRTYNNLDTVKIIFALCSGMIGAGLYAFIPLCTANIIQFLNEENSMDKYSSSIKLLFFISVGSSFFNSLRGRLFSTIGETARAKMVIKTFDKLVDKPMKYFDSIQTGELLQYITHDIPKISTTISLQFNVLTRTLVQSVIIIWYLLNSSRILTLILLVQIPLCIYLQKIVDGYVHKCVQVHEQFLNNAHNIADETFNNIMVIKGFNSETLTKKKFAENINQYFISYEKYAYYYGILVFIMTILPQITALIILFFGPMLSISSTELLSFFLFYTQIVDFFRNFQEISVNIIQIRALSKKIQNIFYESNFKKYDLVLPKECIGHIEFDNVSFSYSNNFQILKNISFSIFPGEHIALVGENGCGKSTIVKLIKRLYLPDKGKLFLDGVDINTINDKWYHDNVVFVPQEPVLLNATIAENIGYNGNFSRLQIENIAKVVDAHNFIMKLEKGYDTIAKLSGGQKQRIALARAIIRNPKVLILDESTSALDTESEANVLDTIDHIIKQTEITVITIAHRQSTIDKCDRKIKIVK